jgi:hypothetical protein
MRFDLNHTDYMTSRNEKNYTDYAKGCRLRVGGSICLGILIVVVAITVAGDDDNSKDF